MMTGSKRLNADMNVTPMIDVLLVLLVIFMIVTPPLSTGLQASLPQKGDQTNAAPDNPLVITIAADRTLALNQQPVPREDLPERLAGVAKLRAHGVVFVQGHKDLLFQDVAEVLDAVRGAGLIASLMPK